MSPGFKIESTKNAHTEFTYDFEAAEAPQYFSCLGVKAFHKFLFSFDVEEQKLSVPCLVFLIRLERRDDRVKVVVVTFYSLEKKGL